MEVDIEAQLLTGLIESEEKKRKRQNVRLYMMLEEMKLHRKTRIYQESEIGKGEWIEVPEYLACSTKYLSTLFSSPSELLQELVDLGYMARVFDGGFGIGVSRYALIRDFEFVPDMKDPICFEEYNKIINKPIRKFLESNDPTGFRFDLPSNWLELIPRDDKTKYDYEMQLNYLPKIMEKFNSSELREIMGKQAICGRQSSVFTNLPRVLRPFLRYRCGSIAEVDINATIPRLLGSVCLSIIEGRVRRAKGRIETYDGSRQLVLPNDLSSLVNNDGEFTKYYSLLVSEIEKYNSTINENDTYLEFAESLNLNLSRQEIKENLLSLIFGSEEDDSRTWIRDEIATGFKKAYPRLYDFIKGENHKYKLAKMVPDSRAFADDTITQQIFKLESRIIKKASMRLKGKSRLTLYDAIYVPAQYRKEIESALKETFETLTGLPYRGKTSLTISRSSLEEQVSIKNVENGKSYYRKQVLKREYTIKTDCTDLELFEFIEGLEILKAESPASPESPISPKTPRVSHTPPESPQTPKVPRVSDSLYIIQAKNPQKGQKTGSKVPLQTELLPASVPEVPLQSSPTKRWEVGRTSSIKTLKDGRYTVSIKNRQHNSRKGESLDAFRERVEGDLPEVQGKC